MFAQNNKKNRIIFLSIFLLFIFLSFVTIKIYQSKQKLINENYFINLRLITIVHENLPWQFTAEEANVKIKPGEVKTIEYIVENLGEKITSGVATFQYYPKEFGNYLTKLNCFCFDKQTLKPGENNKYSLVILIDPKVTKDSKTKKVKEVTIQFIFFDYKEYKEQKS